MQRRATTGSHVLGREDQHQERRAVLHVALRAPRGARIELDGVDVAPDVHRVLDAMADFATRLRGGAFTGKRLRNVVNIGIGGSYLGPEMAYRALRVFSERSMTFRFVVSFCGRRAWREPASPTSSSQPDEERQRRDTKYITEKRRVLGLGGVVARRQDCLHRRRGNTERKDHIFRRLASTPVGASPIKTSLGMSKRHRTPPTLLHLIGNVPFRQSEDAAVESAGFADNGLFGRPPAARANGSDDHCEAARLVFLSQSHE